MHGFFFTTRYVVRYRAKTYNEIVHIYGGLVSAPTFVGFIAAILFSSSLLAVSITQVRCDGLQGKGRVVRFCCD